MAKREIGVGVVHHALGEWRTLDGPRYRRLASGIVEAILRGDLPAGGSLPSERRLAAALSVARGTVVAAYDLLREDGWVERRQGSGTRITTAPSPAVVDVRDQAAGVRARRLTGRFLGHRDEFIDLGVSILPDASALPAAASAISMEEISRIGGRHGYQPTGTPALRRRLAELHTAQGLPTDANQIVVTVGAQQAIALAASLLVKPGDEVIVENPTYPGALDVFVRAGARLLTVPTDRAGARIDVVRRTVANGAVRLVYVMPSFHNPTGALMPEGRRRDLAALADDTDTWVVEDNSLSHLHFGDGPTPAAVAAHSNGERVLTIGSLSKLLWGGLRVGWIRAHPSVVARLGRIKAALDLGNCTVSQAIALRALDAYDDIASAVRVDQRAHADHLMRRLSDALPDWRFDPPAGGLSLWVRLPDGTADDLVRSAATHRVAVLPGGSASADDSFIDHIRLSYALPPGVLDEGVARLAAAWEMRRPTSTVASGVG